MNILSPINSDIRFGSFGECDTSDWITLEMQSHVIDTLILPHWKKKKKKKTYAKRKLFCSLSSAKLIGNSLALFVCFGLLTFDIGTFWQIFPFDFINFVSWKVIWYAKYQGVFWLLATAQHNTFLKRSQSAEKLSLVAVQCVQQICNMIVYVCVCVSVRLPSSMGLGIWPLVRYQFDVISFDMVLNTDGQLFHYFRLLTFLMRR